jgi:hypothetical protein
MEKASLTQIAMAAAPSIRPEKKGLVLEKGPVQLADGSQMKPLTVRNADDALKATLLMLFKHVADIHVSLVEIIAEKYELNAEEMHLAIQNHPKWLKMFDNPMVADLTFETFENSVKPAPVPAAPAPAPTVAPPSPKSVDSKPRGRPKMTEEQKAAAKVKRQAKKSAPAPAPALAPAPAPAPTSKKWICGFCGVGEGNDHRMCICKGYDYDPKKWEADWKFEEEDDDFVVEETPVIVAPKRKIKKSS